ISHPPNANSFNSLNGTNFLISGERASVRLPSRIVLSWVSEPTGCAFPFRTSSTPAINVVLTAPIPGSSTPNLPFGGAILTGLSIPLLLELEFLHSRWLPMAELKQFCPYQHRMFRLHGRPE